MFLLWEGWDWLSWGVSCFFVNNCMSRVSSMGHMFLKRSVSCSVERRRMSILTQNSTSMSRAGCTLSLLITSDILSMRFHSFYVYLSLSPLKITKQIRSKLLILFLFSANSLPKRNDECRATLSRYSENRSVLSSCTTQLIMFSHSRRVRLFCMKKSSLLKSSRMGYL